MSRSLRRLNALSYYAKCHTRNSAYTCVQTLGMYFHSTVTVNLLLYFFFYIFDCLSQFCASHVSDARCKGLIFVHTLIFFCLGFATNALPNLFLFRNFLYFLSFFKLSFCCYVTYMCICSALSCLIMFREIADPHPHVYFRILFHVRVFGMMAMEHEDSIIYDTYD